MDDELLPVLNELAEAIRQSQSDGAIDDTERQELRELLRRVEQVLAEPEGHHGVTEQLEEAAVRFGNDHPTLSAVIRSAIDTLTGYGI